MNGSVQIPGWALGIFLAMIPVTMGLIGWGFKMVSKRIHEDMKALTDKIDALHETIGGLDGRLIRLETLEKERNPPRAVTPPIHS